MTVTLTGNVVTMDLDTNFDGIPDQTYSAGSVPLGLLGTGIGLGGFGGGTMDNFAAGTQSVAANAKWTRRAF